MDTVREHCRNRGELGGVDAQALEHALTMTEQENARLAGQVAALLRERDVLTEHAADMERVAAKHARRLGEAEEDRDAETARAESCRQMYADLAIAACDTAEVMRERDAERAAKEEALGALAAAMDKVPHHRDCHSLQTGWSSKPQQCSCFRAYLTIGREEAAALRALVTCYQAASFKIGGTSEALDEAAAALVATKRWGG